MRQGCIDDSGLYFEEKCGSRFLGVKIELSSSTEARYTHLALPGPMALKKGAWRVSGVSYIMRFSVIQRPLDEIGNPQRP